MKSGYELSINDGDVVKVDNDTITYGLKLNICKDGFKLHKNGFMCGRSFLNTESRSRFPFKVPLVNFNKSAVFIY